MIPQLYDLFCPIVDAASYFLPASDIVFTDLVANGVQHLPEFARYIVADIAFGMQKVLYLVIFYKVLKAIPLSFG